jgi:UDP-N-acetylglucosamine--N-acetylmuramyl-(pentapeptide) pyrophosphoryl-undecaprenol N-acetylglucosamine transferase
LATILIAAGGTGGHLFPAEALASELVRRGHRIELATDHRATSYGSDFPAERIHIVASATITGRSPVVLAKAATKLAQGVAQARRIIRASEPAVVVGFGGYPTVPPLVAALFAGVPTVLHEANAVMGRANRLLAGRVTAVATGFPETRLLGKVRATVTGNPVRPKVLAARQPYRPPAQHGVFRLLVFGGSQGARVFSDLVPPAIAAMAPEARARLRITQQVRPEDVERVAKVYSDLGAAPDIQPFFHDLPERIAGTHLVVARSGASTVAELGVIGRPAILVPLPHALDNDQKSNAEEMERAGAALLAEQARLTPERLAAMIEDLMAEPTRLAAMARAAETVGRPDAVSRLADLVEGVIRV